jgi:hypothetical protein
METVIPTVILIIIIFALGIFLAKIIDDRLS